MGWARWREDAQQGYFVCKWFRRPYGEWSVLLFALVAGFLILAFFFSQRTKAKPPKGQYERMARDTELQRRWGAFDCLRDGLQRADFLFSYAVHGAEDIQYNASQTSNADVPMDVMDDEEDNMEGPNSHPCLTCTYHTAHDFICFIAVLLYNPPVVHLSAAHAWEPPTE